MSSFEPPNYAEVSGLSAMPPTAAAMLWEAGHFGMC